MAKGHTLGATLLLWCSVRYTLSSSGGGGGPGPPQPPVAQAIPPQGHQTRNAS